uniref:Uncharacterized protein n=1 Tax=Oryza brachyantha TaxID=4533 RepID=J3LWL0_ORYBR
MLLGRTEEDSKEKGATEDGDSVDEEVLKLKRLLASLSLVSVQPWLLISHGGSSEFFHGVFNWMCCRRIFKEWLNFLIVVNEALASIGDLFGFPSWRSSAAVCGLQITVIVTIGVFVQAEKQ